MSAGAKAHSAPEAASRHPEAIRVARIISRLNIGGPAIQAISLTKMLEPLGYRTLLLRGIEAEREGSMEDLAAELGVQPVRIKRLLREVGPRDVLALISIARALGRFRPHVVHTHAAKAGTLGRLAALLPGPGRPRAIVHTYHGHSLKGYWSDRRNSTFVRIEKALASRSDRLIAVSDEVRDELVALGVAPPERFEVIPLGFDLSRFAPPDQERARRRAALRSEWGVDESEKVVTLIARLAPIKRVDRFLRVAARLRNDADMRFVVVGDGELHNALRKAPECAELGERLIWAGFRLDMPDVCFASDVVTLTSDNEGTPVSLIEAQAAGTPVVATRVGGMASAVLDGQTGLLAGPHDEEAFARAVRSILADPGRAQSMGATGRRHVLERFSIGALVHGIDDLYRRVLGISANETGVPPDLVG